MNKELNIFVTDVAKIGDPEVLAMLQAFYSRSPMPIKERLANIYAEGQGESAVDKVRSALKTYYVGYGHASIGECGGCTVFIENVSLLAAKAFQDTPLYVGQECSTRYIDYGVAPFLQPKGVDDPVATSLLETIRASYVALLPKAVEHARSVYSADLLLSPKVAADKRESVLEKTYKAIAFDVCRGMLPAGAATSLAWSGSFRTMSDHLKYLAYHPLEEVRSTARQVYAQLLEAYPNSFKNVVLNPEDKHDRPEVYYITEDEPTCLEPRVIQTVNLSVPEVQSAFTRRSPRDNSIYYEIQGTLDFGSYRDLQRHRPGMNRMPLLTPQHGFHFFYRDALTAADSALYQEFISAVLKFVTHARAAKYESTALQYYLPIGFRVPTHLFWSHGHLKYVTALRTNTTVHPTLRRYMNMTAVSTQDAFIQAGINSDPDYAASDRGAQDIVKREPNV